MPLQKAKKVKFLTDPEKVKFMTEIKKKNIMISEKDNLLTKKNAELKSLRRRLEALNHTVSGMRSGDSKEKVRLTEALLDRARQQTIRDCQQLSVYRSLTEECKRCTAEFDRRWAIVERLKKEPKLKTE